MHPDSQGKPYYRIFELLGLAVIYVLTARLGQALAIPPGNITPIWLPSGIILVVVLLRGYSIWPGIFIGAFVGNVWAYLDFNTWNNVGAAVFSGVFNGIGDSLCAVVGAFLIKRSIPVADLFRSSLGTVKFILYGVILGSGISAVFGVSGLALTGFIEGQNYFNRLITWFVGDAVGIIILAPLLLTWRDWKDWRWCSRNKTIELLSLFVLLCAFGFCFFIVSASLYTLVVILFLMMPIFLWSIFRFRSHITFSLIFLVTAIMVVITAIGHGPFYEVDIDTALIELQTFVLSITTMVLVFTASVQNRRDVERDLKQSQEYNQTLINESVSGLVLCDMNGMFIDFNQQYANIIGRGIDEIKSLSYWDITPGDYVEQERTQLALLEMNGHYGPYEKEYLHADGYRVPVRLKGSIVHINGDDYIWSTVEDISEQVYAQAKLSASESKYRAIFSQAADGILTTNERGIITSFNKKAELLFGYKQEEVIKQNISILVPKSYSEKHDSYIKRYNVNHSSKIIGVGRDVNGLHKDGHTFPLYIAISEYTDNEGKYFIAVVHDLSKEKQAQLDLEESKNNFRTLVNASFEGIIIHDNGAIIKANDNASKMFGYTKTDLIGMHFMSTLFTQESIDIAQKNASDGPDESYEIECVRKDGSIFTGRMLSRCGELNGHTVIYAAIRDITQIKKSRDKLKQAKQEAERANKAKSEFISSMSHELRTPLNAVLGFSQLLMMDKGALTEKQLNSVTQIKYGGEHVLSLINDMLDHARIESGRVVINTAEVNLQDVVDECYKLTLPLADRNKIELNFDSAKNYILLCDALRLKQVLLNYLSNAIKYNKHEGEVNLSFTKSEKGLNVLRITVSDTGEGLTEKQQQALFKPFERLEAENTNIQGTGIGLSISKKLTELMGGTVGVDSELGKGSQFWLELELVASESVKGTSVKLSSDEQESVKSTSSENNKTTILYIDDNPTNVSLLEYLFNAYKDKYSYISATKSDVGVEMANEHRPDLILLDIKMPDMDGYEVLAHLRKNKNTKNIPVVAVSANTMPDDITKGKEAGFIDYLGKPIDLEKLLTIINQTLSNK